jgi:hypothetical protein
VCGEDVEDGAEKYGKFAAENAALRRSTLDWFGKGMARGF